MDDGFIEYGKLIDGAMRSIVKEALMVAEKNGLQGDHHFYITFYTDFPGVIISDELKAEYDEEMTIVMQHQYWDMEVNDDMFSITLSFNHKKERLTVPLEAITAFADPSVKFGLQFRQEEDDGLLSVDDREDLLSSDEGNEIEEPVTDGSNVISLETFRKT